MSCNCEFYGKQVVNPGSTSPVYTTPARRQGESATFVLNVLEFYASTSLGVAIEHKNDDETSWVQLGAFSAITGTGNVTLVVGSIKESVRWAFQFSAGVAAGDMYRVQKSVIWLPY